MFKWVAKAFNWIGNIQTVQTILQTQIIKTAVIPFLGTIGTAVLGVFQGVPLMWVCVGSTVVFASIMQGLLRGSEYLARKNPNHKLVYLATHASVDLNEAVIPTNLLGNRHQRRTNKAIQQPQPKLSKSQTAFGVLRTLEKAQVSVEVENTATFPISVIEVSADTEIEGFKPPRTTYPKPPVIIRPGNKVRIADERIEMDDFPCGPLAGKMDFLIRYGLPGKERFEMRLRADLFVHMENFGHINAVGSSWLE